MDEHEREAASGVESSFMINYQLPYDAGARWEIEDTLVTSADQALHILLEIGTRNSPNNRQLIADRIPAMSSIIVVG